MVEPISDTVVLNLILKTVDETKDDVKDIQARVVKLETAHAVTDAKDTQRNRYMRHAVTAFVGFAGAISGIFGVGFIS